MTYAFNLKRCYRLEDQILKKLENDLALKKHYVRDDMTMLRIVTKLKAYYKKGSPDQPRDDHGRWTSGGGSGSFNGDTNDTMTGSSNDDMGYSDASGGDDNSQQGLEGDSIDVAGGFEGVDLSQSVSDFVSSSCKGNIRREIPGEFLNLSLEDFLKKKGAAAHKCYKLINEDRFRK